MKAKWLKDLLSKREPLIGNKRETEAYIQIVYSKTNLRLNGVVSIKEMDELCLELVNRFPWYNMPLKIK